MKKKPMNIERIKFITREYVKSNPDKVFLFGDNLEQIGYGGQAGAMRDEPNAVGIPTKKSPAMGEDAFFSDKEFAFNCSKIFAAIAAVKRLCETKGITTIVIPSDGLGTGLAELDTRAPKTFAYLEERLAELGETNQISKDEILGKSERQTVTPRTVPHGYQIEQWERHEVEYEKAKENAPHLNADDFQIGWDAAFRVIYGG